MTEVGDKMRMYTSHGSDDTMWTTEVPWSSTREISTGPKDGPEE